MKIYVVSEILYNDVECTDYVEVHPPVVFTSFRHALSYVDGRTLFQPVFSSSDNDSVSVRLFKSTFRGFDVYINFSIYSFDTSRK